MMAPTWLPLMLVGILVSAAAAVLEYRRQTVAAIFCGGLASLIFVAVAAVCRMETGDRYYSLYIILGLLLCAVGCVLLNLSSGLEKGGGLAGGLGMAAFIAGHAAFLFTLVYRGYIAFIIAVPLALILAAITSFSAFKRKKGPKHYRGFVVPYLLLSLLVFSWSAALLILNPPDPTYHLFTLGALGLLIYDIDLMNRLFGAKKWASARAAAFGAYATGQLLIALSILFA